MARFCCDVNSSDPGDVLGRDSVAVLVIVAVLFEVSASLKMGGCIIGELSIVFHSNCASD